MKQEKLFQSTLGQGEIDLVLLHGWGMHSDVWETVLDALASEYRLTVIDLPGHGRSIDVPLENLKTMSERIMEVTPANAVYLGWSLGGLVALFMALHYAERVKQLITVAASPCFVAKEGWPGMQADPMHLFQNSVKKAPYLTLKTFVNLQVLKTAGSRKTAKKLLGNLFDYGEPSKIALMEGLKILAETDLRDELQKINCTCCHIFGDEDKIVPVEVATALRQIAPKHEVEIIEQAAHVPFLSHKNEFVQIVKKFIEK